MRMLTFILAAFLVVVSQIAAIAIAVRSYGFDFLARPEPSSFRADHTPRSIFETRRMGMA